MPDLPPTHDRLGNPGRQPNLVRYFTLFMSVLYVALGVYLWFVPAGRLSLGETPRQLLAGVFVVYGIIRFVRTYQQHFKRNQDDAR